MARRSMQVEAKLVVDGNSYAAGIRKAERDTQRLAAASKRANRAGGFSGLTKSALKAAAATASLYTVYDQGKKAVNTTKDLAKGTIQLTRTTGLSTREASRFVAVAKVRGVETQKLATSFTILSKQIVAAQGGSEKATEAFKKLGVSQEAIKKGDTREVFLNAADGLSKMANGANKTALAAQLFGRGYQALFPLLDMGSKGIAEQLQLAGDLGAELSGNSVEAFKKYAQAERTAQLAILGFRLQVGTYLIPKLTEAIGVFQEWVKQFKRGEGPIANARDTVVDLYNAFKPLVKLLLDHPKLVMGAIAAYLVFKATLLGLNLYNAFMTALGSVPLYAASGGVRGAAFGATFTAGVMLGVVALPVLVAGALATAGNIFTQWATRNMAPEIKKALGFDTDLNPFNNFEDQLERIKESVKGTVEWLKGIFGGGGKKNILGTIQAPKIAGLSGLVSKVRGAISSAVKAVSSAAGKMSSSAATLAVSLASGFASRARGIVSAVAKAISSAVAAVRSKVGAMVSAGSSVASGIAQGIRNSFGAVLAAIRDLANSLPSWAKKFLKIGSPSKVFAAIGVNVVEGLALGMRQGTPLAVAAAKKVATTLGQAVDPYTFGIGLGDDFAVALAQADLRRAQGMAKGKKGSKQRTRRNRAIKEAKGELREAEATRDRNDRRRDALAQVKDFISQLVESAKTNFLKPITDAINARALGRTERSEARSRAEIVRRLNRARGAASDPAQRAFLERQQTRLNAQLAAARRRGDTERIGQLEEELFDLGAQLSGAYVSQLEDELAEFDDSVLLRNAEAAADQLGAQLQANLDGAFNALASGAGVGAFLTQFGAAMQATLNTAFGATSAAALGLTPGAVGGMAAGADLGANLVAAGGSTSIPLSEKIANWLRGRSKGKTYKASDIAKDIRSSKRAVYGVTGSNFRGYKIANRVSGGRLSPGQLTMVGETGPELIVGGKVLSGTRTSRLGGGAGMNITINATGAVADNPQLLARELGWQLSTR